jgi:hypothetical protein
MKSSDKSISDLSGENKAPSNTFTPGPWVVRGSVVETEVLQGQARPAGNFVADCDVSHFLPESERDANARLIAAAPDLYRALSLLMDQPTMNPLNMKPQQRANLWATHEIARAALSKAKG